MEELFEFYYERSHEFKGYWPDTLEEFCYKYENDENFCDTWTKKYIEHLNKIKNEIDWQEHFNSTTVRRHTI